MSSRVNHWLNILEKYSDEDLVDPEGRAVIFKDDVGNAISFMLNVACPTVPSGHSSAIGKLNEIERLIEACGGRVEPTATASSSIAELNTVIIIVDHELGPPIIEFSRAYMFKTTYILDCVEQAMLLNLKDYIHTTPAIPELEEELRSRPNFFYDVFYWRKAVLPVPLILEAQARTTQQETEDSDDDLMPSASQAPSTSGRTDNKHTRALYTRTEKEAILKFIIARNAFSQIKGNRLYMDMESHNICPTRTYQSMRNHLLRTLLKELDTFKFLTANQKLLLRNNS